MPTQKTVETESADLPTEIALFRYTCTGVTAGASVG